MCSLITVKIPKLTKRTHGIFPLRHGTVISCSLCVFLQLFSYGLLSGLVNEQGMLIGTEKGNNFRIKRDFQSSTKNQKNDSQNHPKNSLLITPNLHHTTTHQQPTTTTPVPTAPLPIFQGSSSCVVVLPFVYNEKYINPYIYINETDLPTFREH